MYVGVVCMYQYVQYKAVYNPAQFITCKIQYYAISPNTYYVILLLKRGVISFAFKPLKYAMYTYR